MDHNCNLITINLTDYNLAICFIGFQAQIAGHEIIRSYLEQCKEVRKIIILVEEFVHEQFLAHWKESFERVLNNNEHLRPLGHPSQIVVDLKCANPRLLERNQERGIFVSTFRSLTELNKVLDTLNKPKQLQIWTNDWLMVQRLQLEDANRLTGCKDILLNHVPLPNDQRLSCSTSENSFKCLMAGYLDKARHGMGYIYEGVAYLNPETLEELRNLTRLFKTARKPALRCRQVIHTYLNLLSKSISSRPSGLSLQESVCRMKRFAQQWAHHVDRAPGQSQIVTHRHPVGIAILVCQGGPRARLKPLIVDFLFKNLLMGNGVLLSTGRELLGSRFPIDLFKRYHLPFRKVDQQAMIGYYRPMMVSSSPREDLTPNQNQQARGFSQPSCHQEEQGYHSTSRLDSSDEEPELSLIDHGPPPECPEDVYAVELEHFDTIGLTSERVDLLVLELGCRRKRIWYPNAEPN